MQLATAKTLVDLFHRHAKEQNETLAGLQSIEPVDEFQKIKLMIGHTMGSLYADGLHWLYDEHPELKPPEMQKR